MPVPPSPESRPVPSVSSSPFVLLFPGLSSVSRTSFAADGEERVSFPDGVRTRVCSCTIDAKLPWVVRPSSPTLFPVRSTRAHQHLRPRFLSFSTILRLPCSPARMGFDAPSWTCAIRFAWRSFVCWCDVCLDPIGGGSSPPPSLRDGSRAPKTRGDDRGSERNDTERREGPPR
eukprot:scaffold316_cov352-Pavlova_lutheri.AAC.48